MPRRADLSKAKSRASDSAAAESILSRQTQDDSRIQLDKIGLRPSGDTRPLKLEHISELVESISVIGLITPLTVDRKYQLLAGAHRRAALQRLSEEHSDRFQELFPNGIPIRIMDIVADIDTIDALQIEVEENTQRRNYTAAEIKEAARKLEDAGYEKLRGRPSPGQKSLNRELMSVFRLSRRRITDILSEEGKRSEHPCSLLNDLRSYLRKSEQIYNGMDHETSSKELQRVRRDIEKIIVSLRKAIKKEESIS
ncbi:MAG: ParB/RepB/Spo0J family partition protein [Thermosynechococcaceae cyanobacterium]